MSAFFNVGTIKQIATNQGIDVFGIASIEPLWEGQIYLEPEHLFRHLTCGIIMGYRLSPSVLNSIVDGPTLIYKHHYNCINLLLDRAALMVSQEIQAQGYDALPIAASQIIDWERQLGHLSHRSVGALAGLGWIGRSTLLVHPEFGAQVRYVTVLTNAPLPVGAPLKRDCGECRKCIEVCPADAIGEGKEDFDRQACYAKLREFSRERKLGVQICGLCVRVCDGETSR